MTELTEKRTIAFLRTFAERCKSCLRRNPDNCFDCPARAAKNIIVTYDQESSNALPILDYSLAAREKMIIEALAKADKPLAAHDINLHDYCTRQLKHWTLKRLMRLGFIVRIEIADDSGKTHFGYTLKEHKQEV